MVGKDTAHGCGSSGHISFFLLRLIKCPVALDSRRCANKCQ